MKLATPITFTFTDQRVVDFHFDRENDSILVKVAVETAAGISQRYQVVLDKLKQAAVAPAPAVLDAEGKVVTPAVAGSPANGGQVQRLVVNPSPNGPHDVVRVETVDTGSNVAFQRAKQALKQADEIAALEAAGLADGWLLPKAGG